MDQAQFARHVHAALRDAAELSIHEEMISECLIDGDARDAAFRQAWTAARKGARGPQRGWLAGITGHVAESVVEVVLEARGYSMLWHFTGPGSGGHGVDLVVLCSHVGIWRR